MYATYNDTEIGTDNRDMAPVIEVENVYKSFGRVRAVEGIDLTVDEGEFIALLGPNGAGKTTLVEMIEGIQTPDTGAIRVLGLPWAGNEDVLHRFIGLSLQETRFIDRLTVRETLRMFAGFYGLGKSRVQEIMDTVNLAEKAHAYTMNLSGGQRQRMALGIALINRPKVLLLDEPTTGLDPNARRDIWSILLDLKKSSNTSLVLTTHYMEEAEQLCDTIMIIDHGKVLRKGTLEELLRGDTSAKIISFSFENPDLHRGRIEEECPFPIRWDSKNGRAAITVDSIEEDLPEFFGFINARGLRLHNMECRRITLDDLFTAMTGRRLSE